MSDRTVQPLNGDIWQVLNDDINQLLEESEDGVIRLGRQSGSHGAERGGMSPQQKVVVLPTLLHLYIFNGNLLCPPCQSICSSFLQKG